MKKIFVITLLSIFNLVAHANLYITLQGREMTLEQCMGEWELLEQVETAIFASQACYTEDVDEAYGILNDLAQFSDEYNYFFEGLTDKQHMRLAYFDSFSFYDDGNVLVNAETIAPYVVNYFEIAPCK